MIELRLTFRPMRACLSSSVYLENKVDSRLCFEIYLFSIRPRTNKLDFGEVRITAKVSTKNKKSQPKFQTTPTDYHDFTRIYDRCANPSQIMVDPTP